MKLYKITKIGTAGKHTTHENTRWTPGIKQCVKSEIGAMHPEWSSNVLCTDQVIHAYVSLEQLLGYSCGHGFEVKNGPRKKCNLFWGVNPRTGPSSTQIWEAEGEPIAWAFDKVGVTELTLTKKIDSPPFKFEAFAAYTILSGNSSLLDFTEFSYTASWKIPDWSTIVKYGWHKLDLVSAVKEYIKLLAELATDFQEKQDEVKAQRLASKTKAQVEQAIKEVFRETKSP